MTRQRNRRGEGALLRDEIVVAARALLEESGSEDAVTLRAVARRVGIAAPSIYPHFVDRGAILQAVLEATFAELAESLASAATSADDPPARLAAVASAYLDFAERQGGSYAVLFGRTRTEAMPEMTRQRDVSELTGAQAFGVLLDTVRAAEAPGAAPDEVLLTATVLWSTLHGIALLTQTVPAFPWPARSAMLDAALDRIAHRR